MKLIQSIQLNDSKIEAKRLAKEMKNVENDFHMKTLRYEQLYAEAEEL